ncbi:MAG: hypothetical protein M3R00_07290 [Pseudomonadota bacterium]|nr:hypothetical protein [Pseudomonadota bacterium]
MSNLDTILNSKAVKENEATFNDATLYQRAQAVGQQTAKQITPVLKELEKGLLNSSKKFAELENNTATDCKMYERQIGAINRPTMPQEPGPESTDTVLKNG